MKFILKFFNECPFLASNTKERQLWIDRLRTAAEFHTNHMTSVSMGECNIVYNVYRLQVKEDSVQVEVMYVMHT